MGDREFWPVTMRMPAHPRLGQVRLDEFGPLHRGITEFGPHPGQAPRRRGEIAAGVAHEEFGLGLSWFYGLELERQPDDSLG